MGCLRTCWARERQLAAEVFEDKVPDAADVALRTGPAAPAAAGPSADEALPALRPTSAEPQQKGLAAALPAVLRSRLAPSHLPRWAPCPCRRCTSFVHHLTGAQCPLWQWLLQLMHAGWCRWALAALVVVASLAGARLLQGTAVGASLNARVYAVVHAFAQVPSAAWLLPYAAHGCRSKHSQCGVLQQKVSAA